MATAIGMAPVVRPERCPATACARARRAARTAAALAGTAVAAHAVVLVAHAHGPWLTGLLAAMAVLCGICAAEVWSRRSRGGLQLLLSMSLAMAVLHVGLALGAAGGSAHAHGGSAAVVPEAVPLAGGPGIAGLGAASGLAESSGPGWMLGIAGLELAVAWAAGWALRRA